jgi:hypothetical protein
MEGWTAKPARKEGAPRIQCRSVRRKSARTLPKLPPPRNAAAMTHVRSLSPRAGSGWGEGVGPPDVELRRSESRRGPSPSSLRSSTSPRTAGRGEIEFRFRALHYNAVRPSSRGPFLAQRLGLRLRQAPKPLPAGLRVAAAAGSLTAAPLVGAEPERSQQVALRPPYQRDAIAERHRQPLFKRQPAGKASLANVHRLLLRYSVTLSARRFAHPLPARGGNYALDIP